MRVRDLIAATEWHPSPRRNARPVLSVLLPTFRRGSDGMFRKAARSVLSQTMEDLELIIVDDASTDGTLEQVRALMETDDRVSLLRHPRNIGLPAVSEYEAYLQARGTFISFAFDDFVFEKTAFESLLRVQESARAAVVHGLVAMPDMSGNTFLLGEAPYGHDKLRWSNFLGNAGVLMTREVIETVGFYDPHVILSRLCDWDLWYRIQKRFEIVGSRVQVGRELGSSRPDSLGNTYPMRFEVVHEFMALPRDTDLIPGRIENRDVLFQPQSCSVALANGIREVSSYFENKFWYEPLIMASQPEPAASPPPVVSVYGDCNASVSLYFVSEELPFRRVRFIEPAGNTWYENSQLATSDLVIFVREFLSERQASALRFCRLAQIPHLYFCDDNFNALIGEDPAWNAYSLDRMRSELTTFQAVLVSSRELRDFFIDNALHTDVDILSPIFDESLLEKIRKIRDGIGPFDEDELRITYFGGPFRNAALLRDVLPALDALPNPTRLQVRETPETYPTTKFSIEFAAPSLGFSHFLESWCKFKPNIIVHPSGTTSNIHFKSDNAILVACYLGAVPILANERAYEGIGYMEGVEKAGADPAQWYKALQRLVEAGKREEAYLRLLNFCRRHFSADASWRPIAELLEGIIPLTEAALQERYRLAAFYTPVHSIPPDRRTLRPSDVEANAVIKLYSDRIAAELVRQGKFESNIEGLYVKGWANIVGSSEPCRLDLHVDGHLYDSFDAAIYRADLAEAGKGDGRRAFLIPISPAIGDGRVHRIELRLAGGEKGLVKFLVMSAEFRRGLARKLRVLLGGLK
ncbi:glycosyltransferase family 2 protein [Methylobacterium longum]|uniref:Glycosyltransferase family 2 protein n=1 Tax=Methylobacterium longum TaxID=767694 RepID=A0ABT8AWH0_9HYPH|nr:glycosyltransferase family 2 protein [Methylobacterium longum]MDN3573821.1 glycosyltransferase family 2 protein [Methylobacterium longum]GJE14955.1 hypothetical protein FOHLNKBM_6032 [Methylobacterium longum]